MYLPKIHINIKTSNCVFEIYKIAEERARI